MKHLIPVVALVFLTSPVPQNAEMERLTACYAQAMRLAPWMISVVPHDTVHGDNRAYTSWDMATLRARVAFNPVYTDTASLELKKQIVVHEMAHLLVSELYMQARRVGPESFTANERLAALISTWPLWQRMCG